MSELIDVIGDAISDAEMGHADTGLDTSTELPATEAAGDAGETSTAASAVAALTPDEIEQELAGHGIKPPMEGQRENRIPYSRVRKILENARKKESDKYATQFKEHTDKLTKAEERARLADQYDQMIDGDEVQFLTRLAQVRPKYARFLQQQAEKVEAVAAESADDQEPAPDYKFEDGSLGYTAEGYRRHNAWLERSAVRKAEAAIEKKYGATIKSIQDRDAIAAQNQRSHQAVQLQYNNAQAAWGQMFVDDWKAADQGKSEVLKYMGEHKGTSMADACAAVFLPKVRAEAEAAKAKARTEVMDELNKRPAAANTAPAGQSQTAEKSGPRTTEDIIREQIARLKR